MANSFGNSIKISIFGESHSAAIGVVMDGLPSGLTVDLDEVQKEMDRRAPGRNRLSTPRREADIPHVVSGLFRGKTTGTPLCAVIENTNTRSGDYEPALLRPSHADYAALCRYHGFADYRGIPFIGRKNNPAQYSAAYGYSEYVRADCRIGGKIQFRSVKHTNDRAAILLFKIKQSRQRNKTSRIIFDNRSASCQARQN